MLVLWGYSEDSWGTMGVLTFTFCESGPHVGAGKKSP